MREKSLGSGSFQGFFMEMDTEISLGYNLKIKIKEKREYE